MADSPVQGECFQLAHNYFKNIREIKAFWIIKADFKKELWRMTVFACFYADWDLQQRSSTRPNYNYGLKNVMLRKISPKLLRNLEKLKSDLGRINQSFYFIYCNCAKDNPTILHIVFSFCFLI